MTYHEILSAAQSLSETERQSLVQALSTAVFGTGVKSWQSV